jgi:hypothetical protein
LTNDLNDICISVEPCPAYFDEIRAISSMLIG